MAIQGFFKNNYRKNLRPKITRLINTCYLEWELWDKKSIQ